MKDAIITAVAVVNPPLRRLLGKVAVDTALRKIGAAGSGLDAWCAAWLASDFAADSAVEVGH